MIVFQEPSDFIDMFCRTGSTHPWRVFESAIAAGETPRSVLDAQEANRILTISCVNLGGYFPVGPTLHPEKMNHVSDLQRHLGTLTAQLAIENFDCLCTGRTTVDTAQSK
jgi:hypothetical protein